MQYTDIGIDLGTASILVYIRGKGVVLKEPSVVAFDRDTNKIKAIGEDARLMLGRTPGNIVAVRPLRQGVISDYTVTEKMMKYFIQKALGRKTFRRPRIAVCVPSGVTEVEKKAVEDATYQAGAREVSVIEEPIAAAIGAGIDISKGMIASIKNSGWTTAVMTFLVADTLDGAYTTLYDDSGQEVSMPVVPGKTQAIAINAIALASAKFIKPRSGNDAAVVAQGADRTITFSLKR